MLEVGTKVEDFTLLDGYGKSHRLSDYKGKKVVLYFYPEDHSPGCTIQACTFRDMHHDLEKSNVILMGISTDDATSHKKFIEDFDLPFILLSDIDKTVSTYFGAYGKKNMYGKIVVGMIRSTFIIDENGVIEKVFKRASAKTNASSVLAYIKA